MPNYYYGPYTILVACAIAMISTYMIYLCVDWKFGEEDFDKKQLYQRSFANLELDAGSYAALDKFG